MVAQLSLFPYIGSKKMLLKKIDKYFPDTINNYYEPFIGGGSVFFYLNEQYKIKKNYINDLDSDLINVFKTIKNDKKILLKYLSKLDKLHSKKDFQTSVDIFNTLKQNKTLVAAIYFFIAKRSFNGRFNYNKYDNMIKPNYANDFKNKHIYDEEIINKISTLLGNTNISNLNYIDFLSTKHFKKDDFVFMDPPYLMTNSQYFYKNDFDLDEYNKLYDLCYKLDKKNVNFMLTTNKHFQIKKLFKDFNIKTVEKYSHISRGKGTEYEYVITNY